MTWPETLFLIGLMALDLSILLLVGVGTLLGQMLFWIFLALAVVVLVFGNPRGV